MKNQESEENKSCIFKYNNGNSAILCSTCSGIIKVGYQFNDDEILALRGTTQLGPQYCKECMYKSGEIFASIPGTVEDYQETVKITLYKNKGFREIGRIDVPYMVWDQMDSDSLACEGTFTYDYVLEQFHKIVWN